MSSSKLMMRPVILSSPEKLAFLLTIFCAGGSVTTSSPGCSVAGDLRHALGLALAWRQSRQRIGAGRRDRDALVGLRRGHRDARRDVLRNDGGARRRRQRLRLHRAGRRHALPRQRPVGRRQHPALRQFRHLFLVVGRRLLVAAGNAAGRARRGIGKDIADLRARRAAQARSLWRPAAPQNRSGQWFETSRGFNRRIGLATLYRLIRRSQGHRLTRRIRRGKGGSRPPGVAATGQPARRMK